MPLRELGSGEEAGHWAWRVVFWDLIVRRSPSRQFARMQTLNTFHSWIGFFVRSWLSTCHLSMASTPFVCSTRRTHPPTILKPSSFHNPTLVQRLQLLLTSYWRPQLWNGGDHRPKGSRRPLEKRWQSWEGQDSQVKSPRVIVYWWLPHKGSCVLSRFPQPAAASSNKRKLLPGINNNLGVADIDPDLARVLTSSAPLTTTRSTITLLSTRNVDQNARHVLKSVQF